MGVVSTIVLKDKYTNKAKNIVSSAEAMDKAFKKNVSTSRKLESALDVAFGKTREVKIKDIKSKSVRKSIQGLQSDLRKATGKDYRVRVTARTSHLEAMKKKLSDLKSKISGVKNSVIKVKTDAVNVVKAKLEVRKLSKELTKATGKRHKVRIGLEGGNIVTRTIDSIKNKLSGLKSGASNKLASIGSGLKGLIGGALPMIGGIAGAGAVALGGGMLKSGSALEQQQISMTHFLGGDQKQSDAYLAQLRENANVTPFETGEVVQAGTRAVQIAGGDTKKGMEFVKLAEDMAALNPGKSISDAMEALADADMGEMERLNFSLAA